MEAEPLELEDGEILDDEPNDVFGTYKVLQRPYVAPVTNVCTKMRYSDESDNSADSESESDSDSAHNCSKRLKLKPKKYKNVSHVSALQNNKYKVWCSQVQEESLTEDLISCGVTKNLYQERSVESYNVPLRHNGSLHRNNNSSDDEKDIERRVSNKRTSSDRHNVKLRLGKRRNFAESDVQKGSAKIIADLSTTVESTNDDIATDITNKLEEKKDLLIRRVVDIIGKEKAIDFFQKTKEIEKDGGMLIMNGSRRRTAGGIYFWLVKNDEHIPQEKIREIFYYDQKETTEQRRKNSANVRRQKTQELMKSIENESNKDLPALLTRAELSTREIAEEARLRRGEDMDRMPLDSDHTVSNPPPSPVTDDPDHSENPLIQRQVQDYDDDFLDIGIDIDSMEVL